MGVAYVRWHDHFVVPRLDEHMIMRGDDEAAVPGKDNADLNTADDEAQILTLRPGVLEQLSRHMIWHHLYPDMYRDDDVLSINHYYADTVYAPIYHGYGEPGTFADRHQRAREWDMELLELAPDTVLVHIEADAQTVRKRMTTTPARGAPLRQENVPLVLRRFREELDASLSIRLQRRPSIISWRRSSHTCRRSVASEFYRALAHELDIRCATALTSN